MTVLALKWKDLMATFFDETHARSLGLNTNLLRIVFFTLLSACTVAALQTQPRMIELYSEDCPICQEMKPVIASVRVKVAEVGV